MEDGNRQELIDALIVSRDERVSTARSGRLRLWVSVSCGALIIVGALIAWIEFPHKVILQTAEAKEISNSSIALAPKKSSISQLDASGYVVARRQATVSAAIGGRVVEVLVSEGSRVQKGDVVARLDAEPLRLSLNQAKTQLEAEMARLSAAEVALKNAEPLYHRVSKQREAGFSTAQDLDNARSSYESAQANVEVEQRAVDTAKATVAIAERDLTDAVVRAPFTGVITSRSAQPGEIVSPSAAGGSIRTGIGTIVDMDSLEVEVDVSENFINRVQPKQSAIVKLNAYPDWEIPAEVITVIPAAERAKATVKVRVGFKERDARILPDMGVRVSFL